MKKVITTILAFLFLFLLLPPANGWCQTKQPPQQIEGRARQVRQALHAFTETLKPFLSGSLPEKTYLRLFRIASEMPSAKMELKGHHLLLSKILTSFFPTLCKKMSFKGVTDLTIALERGKDGTKKVTLTLTLKSPIVRGNILVTAERMMLTLHLSLNQRLRAASGSFRCRLISPEMTLSSPLRTRLAASCIDLRGTLKNRRYSMEGTGNLLQADAIQWGKYAIKNPQIQTLTLTPNGLAATALSMTCLSQSLILKALSLRFSPLAVRLEGALGLRMTDTFFPPESPIESLKGRVHFKFTGNFQLHAPTLLGTIWSDNLEVTPYYVPAIRVHFHVTPRYQDGQVTLSNLNVSAARSATLQGFVVLPRPASPLLESHGEASLHVTNLKALQPLLQAFFPTLLPNLDAEGRLSTRIIYKIQKSILSASGRISMKGTLKNILAPVALKGLTLNLPFNLRIPLPGASSPSTSDFSPMNVESGKLEVSSIEFGFLRIHDTTAHLTATGHTLRLGSLDSHLLLGEAQGKGQIDLIPPYSWNTDLQLNRVSLHELCNQIPGMKDALSGRVNATLTLSGDGGKLDSMQGAFKANVIKTHEEPRRISQAFIRQLTGRKGRFFFYKKYRPYNKGVIRAEVERGIIVFKTLEISHSLLGFKDLSMSVSRFANRISLKDLIWEILQVPRGQSMSHPVIKTK